MIGQSFPEFIFIRISILLLRAVPLIAVLYSASRLVVPRRGLPLLLEYYLFAECLFYFTYLRRRYLLQKPAVHPPVKSRTDRQELFARCLSSLPDAEKYIATWFLSPSSSPDVKRENCVDWLLWALFATDRRGFVEGSTMEEELDEYITKFEHSVGRKFEPGRNPALQPIRLTLDPVSMLPRPLVWYAIVALVDFITYTSLHKRGFRHYAPSVSTEIFPPRPLTFLSRWSVARNFPYWYRPHRSASKLPVVILHGIGIGLWPYIPFMSEISEMDPDVGILALEILPISMRITYPMPSQALFIEQLTHILVLHGITRFMLVSHSYGSVLTTHILRSPLAPRVASILLVDPVTLLLHCPEVAYNFVYREPRTANEWQLWYFASRDMGISHTLSRHFFWSDNILWKEDLVGRNVGIVLSGKDQIVPTREIWSYLTGQKEKEPSESWNNEGGNLHILWFPRLDHAQVFDTPERRRPLLDLIEKFTTNGRPSDS